VQIAGGTQTTLPLLIATVSDGIAATIIFLAMSLGLIVPKMLIDFFGDRRK
jgi:thiol:disulfide interchange protein